MLDAGFEEKEQGCVNEIERIPSKKQDRVAVLLYLATTLFFGLVNIIEVVHAQ